MLDSRGIERAGRVIEWIGMSIAGAVLLIVVASIAWVLLVPHGGCGKSDCESNMKQIGSSMKMYLTDWHDTYPTNRSLRAHNKLGGISCAVQLTIPTDYTKAGRSRNLSWVEAMYKYMEPPTADAEGNVDCGAWQCKAASTDCHPSYSKTAYTAYVMNRNLVEQPEGVIRCSDKLMLCREVDGLVNSELRPMNTSTDAKTRPDCPFLTGHDRRMGNTGSKIHANGSHLLFADGHVSWFQDNVFNNNHCQFDASDCEWWNAVTQGDPATRKRIAITP